MQVTVEDVSSVKKILHIEVPQTDVAKELDATYKDLKKNVKVNGFRPGKAPRSVLERLYKKNVNADLIPRIIQESFIEALKETKFKVIGEPDINPSQELNANASYKYDAVVEIKPEIVDIDFKGMVLKRTIYTVQDEDIDAQIEMFRGNLANYVKIEEERPAQEGDHVLIDYEGFEDGKSSELAPKTEKVPLKIGNSKIIKEFDDNLIGLNIGEEKSFDIEFPEKYPNAQLANHKINFNVKLHEIRKQILPEANDEFAKQLGSFDSLDTLKKEIRKNLEEGYEKRVEQEMQEQIFQTLGSKLDFELPEIMVNYELNSIVDEAKRAFESSNMSFEQVGKSEESVREEYRSLAEKQVQRHLILDKIVEQEKLELADEELDQAFQEMADTFKQPVDVIKKVYSSDKNKLEGFKNTLLEKRAIKLIIDSNTVEDVDVAQSSDVYTQETTQEDE